MSQGFGYPAFPVDTHIQTAQRWKLTNGKNVTQTEKDLKNISKLYGTNSLQIFYGREFYQQEVVMV